MVWLVVGSARTLFRAGVFSPLRSDRLAAAIKLGNETKKKITRRRRRKSLSEKRHPSSC